MGLKAGGGSSASSVNLPDHWASLCEVAFVGLAVTSINRYSAYSLFLPERDAYKKQGPSVVFINIEILAAETRASN